MLNRHRWTLNSLAVCRSVVKCSELPFLVIRYFVWAAPTLVSAALAGICPLAFPIYSNAVAPLWKSQFKFKFLFQTITTSVKSQGVVGQRTFSWHRAILTGHAVFVLPFLRRAYLRWRWHSNRSLMQVFVSFPWSRWIQNARRHEILHLVGDHIVDHRLCDPFQMAIEFVDSQRIVGWTNDD